MIRELLYLCGAPGVGKSTLARELRSGWDTEVHRAVRVPHVRLIKPATGRWAGMELGLPRDSFPGTDTLSMSIAPRASEWLKAVEVDFALGEGARLATRPFLGGLHAAGVHVTLLYLHASSALLEERWHARGARQNPAWRRGAATRAGNIFEWGRQTQGVRALMVDTERDPLDVQADMVRRIFPSINPKGES